MPTNLNYNHVLLKRFIQLVQSVT